MVMKKFPNSISVLVAFVGVLWPLIARMYFLFGRLNLDTNNHIVKSEEVHIYWLYYERNWPFASCKFHYKSVCVCVCLLNQCAQPESTQLPSNFISNGGGDGTDGGSVSGGHANEHRTLKIKLCAHITSETQSFVNLEGKCAVIDLT